MKLKRFLIVYLILLSVAGSIYSQDCRNVKDYNTLTDDINNKKNVAIATKINTAAIDFLHEPNQAKLEILKCVLQFVINQSGIPKQKASKDNLVEVINYLAENSGLIAQNFAHLSDSQKKNLKESLNNYGALTNDLYVRYMNQIDKYTDGRIIIKPESVLTGYEQNLQDYNKISLKNISNVFNYLVSKKLIITDKNDMTKEPRSAQKLYDKLRQLESSLTEENTKSRLDFFGNRKRLQQIATINEIKNALIKIYGEFISYYTTFPASFNEKFSITKETNSVVFASIALALNTIIQELSNKIYEVKRGK